MSRRATAIIPPAVAGRPPSLYASDMAARPIDEQIDKLYQLPLEEFTAARNALAKEAGPAAAEVKALQKPPLAAWAINQVYWRGRPAFHALTASASALRNAHTAVVSGKRGDLRAAGAAHEEALEAVLKAALAVLRDAGTLQPTAPSRRLPTRCAHSRHRRNRQDVSRNFCSRQDSSCWPDCPRPVPAPCRA